MNLELYLNVSMKTILYIIYNNFIILFYFSFILS